MAKYSHSEFKRQLENYSFLVLFFGFFFMFTRIKGVEIAVLSVTISSAQRAFLLNTAFSVTANTAQRVPEQCQADLEKSWSHSNTIFSQFEFSE